LIQMIYLINFSMRSHELVVLFSQSKFATWMMISW